MAENERLFCPRCGIKLKASMTRCLRCNMKLHGNSNEIQADESKSRPESGSASKKKHRVF